uniref:Uncharacterized protein n=1 Tax=Arundo donax TaxID=35708 RepID=A0A0A8YPA4_ARUDO
MLFWSNFGVPIIQLGAYSV